MGTLILKLAGPLQSWGAESRFTERKTRHEPTKSGVVGLLASALGRRRSDDISDLACCTMAVRVDVPGSYERDFQTAHTRKFDQKQGRWVSDKPLPLSYRYYLSDACFVVGVSLADGALLDTIADALDRPSFPLYLGRRSCSPAGRILFDVNHGDALMDALGKVPWQASEKQARMTMSRRGSFFNSMPETIELSVVRDILPNDTGTEMRDSVRDIPLSFSQENRSYGWRTVVIEPMSVGNPYHSSSPTLAEHDPFTSLEEVS